jgi:hypothetical protein
MRGFSVVALVEKHIQYIGYNGQQKHDKTNGSFTSAEQNPCVKTHYNIYNTVCFRCHNLNIKSQLDST